MDEKLKYAVSLYKNGNKPQAAILLAEIVKQDPNNSTAWYGLALCLDEADKKVYCLKKVVSLDPSQQKARQLLEKLLAEKNLSSISTKQTAENRYQPPTQMPASSNFKNETLAWMTAPKNLSSVSTKQTAENQNQPPTQMSAPSDFKKETPDESKPGKQRLLFALLGVVLLVIVACIVGFIILNKGGGVSAEFKSNLNAFLVKGEKLNVLTEQGVSNGDFRNQLAEVKSAYSMLNNAWPSSLSAEKNSFDQAIKGWELTLEVWDYGLDKLNEYTTSLNSVYLPENSTILKDCTEYTNSNPDYAHFNSIKSWIGVLMGQAGQYFDEGKTSINSKLK